MKNKKRFILLIILFIICLLGFSIIHIKNNKIDKIDENYLAIFHGNKGSKTYIYKLDTGKANYGFKYINVKNNEIIEKGNFNWTDDAFLIAKKNKAYSYVTIPNSKKKYTISEYQDIFLMN